LKEIYAWFNVLCKTAPSIWIILLSNICIDGYLFRLWFTIAKSHENVIVKFLSLQPVGSATSLYTDPFHVYPYPVSEAIYTAFRTHVAGKLARVANEVTYCFDTPPGLVFQNPLILESVNC
jgi:hypothetical protein